MSCAVVSCGLLLALATLTVHAQLQTPLATTTGCRNPRCPSTKCPEVLNCPGSLVVDNERCPCCHVCGLQLGEECSPETTDNVTAFRYCDAASGFTCKKVSNDDGSGTAVGRCVGTHVPPCVEGRTYKKGCLKCNCTDGSLKCEKDKGITCLALTCGAKERYRPVDKCCEVCVEVCLYESPALPPAVALPGGLSKFRVTFREELRLTFTVGHLAPDLAQDNMLSNLGIYRNGRELLPTSKYLSIQIVRVSVSPSGPSFCRYFVEITFILEAAKKTDSGNYTLLIENRVGTTSTSFILQVIKRRLKNCTFETDLCDWINGGNLNENEVGWLRRMGETPSHSTGPVAGYGGSGVSGCSFHTFSREQHLRYWLLYIFGDFQARW
ncbi:uncharacterized protein LOC134182528 isoform X2 [Corticium candelabrum]|uniref:uncharacterized protein LOC134182528 isoform X2 n=1 Tax=Corticium candelabrum TaxID=121492 RepID=UPI002E270B5F|nr:uncharacterized protein LOC134182528 isoform X2 [Corticium candelabrum]